MISEGENNFGIINEGFEMAKIEYRYQFIPHCL
jgi:hypothetical protein